MTRWRAIILLLAGLITARADEFAEVPPARPPARDALGGGCQPNQCPAGYPRPQLVRADWQNLNGLWDYAITPINASNTPSFVGKILVPFPVESVLSGVKTNLDERSKLWYHRVVSVPGSWHDRRVRLHFGAVDWRCQVWINGHAAGQHQGGYDAFTFDVTDALHWDGKEEITVCVTDPTEGDQPRGKQARKPEGIFYTSTSGIWQTVWLEPVPQPCIDRLKITPEVGARSRPHLGGGKQLCRQRAGQGRGLGWRKRNRFDPGPANGELVLSLPGAHLWSPDDPFLYDLKVTLEEGERTVDSVSSYFGMRKIALSKDAQGFTRMALNGQFTFEIGTLDQGFWPDGIYTAPTDEALRYDIEFLRSAASTWRASM